MMTMAAWAPGYEVFYSSTTLTPAQLLPVQIQFFSEDRCQEQKTLLLCVVGSPECYRVPETNQTDNNILVLNDFHIRAKDDHQNRK